MPDSDTDVPWNSPKLRAILASTLVLPLGVALLSPALAVIRDAFGLTDLRASLLITYYFVPGIVVSPIIGLLADRYGRHAVMIPSLTVFGLSGGAIATVDAFTVIFLLRLVQGTAAAGVFLLTVTFINDVFDGVQRNAVLGVNSAVLFTGAAIYPFLGGVLASINWNIPFLTYFVAIPVAIYAYFRLEEPPIVHAKTGPGYLHGAAAALPPTEAVALYAATFIREAIVVGAILTAIPFILAADFSASPVVSGIIVTMMMVMAAIVSAQNGNLAQRWSNHRLVVISFWCYGIGLLITWVGSSVLLVGAGTAVVGAGSGLAQPSIDAAVARLAPPEYRAGALSINSGLAFLGRATGPIAFTSLGFITGYRILLLTTGVATLILGAIGLVVSNGEPALGEESMPP